MSAPKVHVCVRCVALPEYGAVPGTPPPYRPKTPRPIADGCTPRRPYCKTHQREAKRERLHNVRTKHKAAHYGVPRHVQVALWEFQGHRCPCGRKASPTIPAGVTLDHDHRAPCVLRGDHPENRGCLECVTGFVCGHCNREILGRLEGALKDRDRVAAGLHLLAAHVTNPPLARLLAEQPELLEATP